MAQTDPSGSLNGDGGYGWSGEGRERGARRRKMYGYLKAANELRQSYSVQWSQSNTNTDDEDQGIPGAFPNVEIVRSGDEEMVLFPSYARRHVRKYPPSQRHQDMPGSNEDIQRPLSSGDADYWKREWEKYEDDNAIIDVDVRGWIYSPHRGPMTRKNRLLIAVARRLSGIPAPGSSQSNSRASSRHSTHRERVEDRSAKKEDEMASKEAQSIIRRGEGEADVAWRGGYSEEPGHDWDRASAYSSRSASPDIQKDPVPGKFPHPLTDSSLVSDTEDPGGLAKRRSWNQPANMTREELAAANTHLMTRLKPFLTNPLTQTPITVFFFNDKQSTSRNINTNEAGHFSLRASLEFVPTSVRVLASEDLSATEEIIITEPTGISLVSDIDDTIKHSAIGNGAKEIFRNTFIRDLGDLKIQGVKEWYSKLASMDVTLHYVSNSPWQLYPLLRSYFALAGLPPGSFHLKQYTGMLQGIFEPAAEKKKGSLEKIMRDFPERRFILVGDSGEADLEVYTDIVMANPGRILGVFIRDVTTPERKRFFDQSAHSLGGNSLSASRRGSENPSHASSTPNEMETKPALPPRMYFERSQTQAPEAKPTMGDLIDFSEDQTGHDERPQRINQDLLEIELELEHEQKGNRETSSGRSPPPAPPSKPMALRSVSTESGTQTTEGEPDMNLPRRTGPPPPPKPRRLSSVRELQSRVPLSERQNGKIDPGSSQESQGYTSTVRNKVTSAYNSLPSARTYWNGPSQSPTSTSQSGGDASQPSSATTSGARKPPPPVPPRRAISSYPAAAAQYASNRLSWGGGSEATGGTGTSTPPLNKKEEVWNRRWARAKEVLDSKGVMLKSWRVGSDVMDDAVRLVERATKDM